MKRNACEIFARMITAREPELVITAELTGKTRLAKRSLSVVE
jgi:hypothetical protein